MAAETLEAIDEALVLLIVVVETVAGGPLMQTVVQGDANLGWNADDSQKAIQVQLVNVIGLVPSIHLHCIFLMDQRAVQLLIFCVRKHNREG